MVEVFPVVLCHQTKQGQKGPPKGVEAGVAIVGVSSCLQTDKPVRTLPAAPTQKHNVTLKAVSLIISRHFYILIFFVDVQVFVWRTLEVPIMM